MAKNYAPFGGKRIARHDTPGSVNYYLSDHLGSSRVVTNSAGTILDDCDFTPFGEERCVSSSSGNTYKFTGKERDPMAEGGKDYFPARYYVNGFGRWLSPDEYTGGPTSAYGPPDPAPPGALPYADITNPQSLNKYAYVYNNPLRYVDPTGRFCLKAIWGGTCNDDPQPPPLPPPKLPKTPLLAMLKTDMKGGTTTWIQGSAGSKDVTVVAIPTQNVVDPKSEAGANDPYRTHDIVGVVHVGENKKAYGPDGAYIKTGDSRKRDIHGGGSALVDWDAPYQSRLMPTYGCTRGYNQDVINLQETVTSFQEANPDVPIPYFRE